MYKFDGISHISWHQSNFTHWEILPSDIDNQIIIPNGLTCRYDQIFFMMKFELIQSGSVNDLTILMSFPVLKVKTGV